MDIVLWTALGVGASTVIGAAIGFAFKNLSHRFSDIVLSFAAGIMLAASVLGLILPAVEAGGKWGLLITIAGVFTGAVCLNLFDRVVPHLHKLSGVEQEGHPRNTEKLNKVLLFVTAIAIHNLPEGIAAGVSFGNDDVSAAITVAVGIALQNIPEGIVTVSPLVMSGVSRGRAFLLATATGFIEVAGTLLGFFVANLSAAILPFALAFAGGTMLYIISDEMIPETHSHGYERTSTYSLLVGFTLMLIMDMVL